MRRLVFLTALVVLVPFTAFAQRGGMHGGSSAGHGGFASPGFRGSGFYGSMGAAADRFGSSGFHGPMAGPARFGGPQSGVHFHGAAGSSFWHGGHGNHFHLHFYSRFSPYYGYPYFGYYSPFAWDWYNSSYDSGQSEYVAQQQSRQIDELSQEVQRLREQQEYALAAPAPAAPPAPAPATRADVKAENDLPVVLVFLDRRIQEVKNYAIANEVLTSFDDHKVKKIPLADLDLAATMKLNDERGVSFDVPNPTASQ